MTASNGFDFTTRLRLICEQVSQSMPEFSHVDMSRVAVSFAQARMRTSWGMYASLTPLRFPGGGIEGQKRGRRYAIQQIVDRSGRHMLYILTFYLPRFQDQSFREKLITIFHELWHISPQFDGDLRRHEGRCYAHTHSQANYDAHMAVLVDRWLQLSPPPPLLDFLEHDFHSLQALHGRIFGVKVPRPKLIPRTASGGR